MACRLVVPIVSFPPSHQRLPVSCLVSRRSVAEGTSGCSS
jgi:hypothetical protein